MKLTKEKTGHHYLTEIGTVLNTKDGGKRDSLGRTARAMMVYDDNWIELFGGVLTYFDKWGVYRYKGSEEKNSRDHVVIAFACMRGLPINLHGFKWLTSYYSNKTKPRFTFGQRIWVKAMFSRFWSIVYLAYKLPGLAVIYPAWNWFWRAISGTLRTYKSPADCAMMAQMNVGILFNQGPPTKWQKFCFKLTLKAYASFYTLYEINALESNWAKRILQRVMILHFEKSNYVARALCGQNVSYPDGYMPSRSNRWSVRLDRTCDRSMQPYNDTEEDNLELGMLKHYCK